MNSSTSAWAVMVGDGVPSRIASACAVISAVGLRAAPAMCHPTAKAPPAATGLVDDVCTTGATLLAAASALSTAGGSVGAFLVLAVPHTLSLPLVTLPE